MISNSEILLRAVGGQVEPFKGQNGLYNILYKTIFLIDGRVYIGVHSSSRITDSYIGCGVDREYSSELFTNYSKNSFVGLVKRYGVQSFKRENLLYFNSVDEALLCEKYIVNREWVRNSNTLNLKTGGYRPPTLLKEKNGNYRNFWSPEKKKEMSRKRIEGGKSKGSLNGNAKPVIFIDVYTLEKYPFNCAKEAWDFFKPKTNYYTLLTFLFERKLYDRRWCCLWLEDYIKIGDVTSLVDEMIENSRFKKEILNKRNDYKKY